LLPAFHLTLQERLKVLRAISHEIYITATELNQISTDAADGRSTGKQICWLGAGGAGTPHSADASAGR